MKRSHWAVRARCSRRPSRSVTARAIPRNPATSAEEWLKRPGSPKPKLANEKPKGVTVPYDQLLEAWREGRVR